MSSLRVTLDFQIDIAAEHTDTASRCDRDVHHVLVFVFSEVCFAELHVSSLLLSGLPRRLQCLLRSGYHRTVIIVIDTGLTILSWYGDDNMTCLCRSNGAATQQ